MADNRFRNWSFIGYWDSLPNDWIVRLNELHVECYISPEHDRDINPDGSLKKRHWHIILCFEGKKSFEQIKEITDSLNCPHPQYVNSLRGMARYLCHLDNPEKVQYSPSEVTCLSGADYYDVIKLASDDRRNRQIILELIRDNNVSYYSDLIDLLDSLDSELLEVCCKNTYFFTGYIKERRYKFKDERGIKDGW